MFKIWGCSLLVAAGLAALNATAHADSIQLGSYSNLSAGVDIEKNEYGVSGYQIYSLPTTGSVAKSGYGGESIETVDITSDSFDDSYDLTLAKSASAEVGGGGVIYFTPLTNIQYTLAATVSLTDKTTTSKPSISLLLGLTDDDSGNSLYDLYQTVSQNNYSYTLTQSNINATGSLTGTLLAGNLYEWDPDVFVTNASKNPISESGTVDFSLTFSPLAPATPLPLAGAGGMALLAAVAGASVRGRRRARA